MRRLLATVAPLVLLIGTAATHAQSRDMTKSLQDFCHSFDTTRNTNDARAVGRFLRKTPSSSPQRGHREGLGSHYRLVVQQNLQPWADEPSHHVESASASGNGVWGYGEATVSGNPASHAHWAAYDIHRDGEWRVQMPAVIPTRQCRRIDNLTCPMVICGVG